MKKLRVVMLMLLITLLAFSLAACKGSEKEEAEPEAPQEEEEVEEKEWFEMVDNDWEENFVDLDTGIKMCYMTMGPEDGQPIMLVHGATDSRLSYAQVAPILADKGYRVYIPELRGHGKTDKPESEDGIWSVDQHVADITNFMDKMKLENIDIVGHSLGTFISQGIAIEHPEKAKSITLIASGAKMKGNETLEWCMNGDGKDYLGAKGYDEEGEMPDDFVRDWAACDNEDKDFDEGIYLHARKNLPYYAWAHIFGGLLTCDNTDRLDKITCPVQIIWGTEDVIFLKEDQDALKEGLKNSAKVVYNEVEGATHNTHWDSKAIADQVAGMIADFTK